MMTPVTKFFMFAILPAIFLATSCTAQGVTSEEPALNATEVADTLSDASGGGACFKNAFSLITCGANETICTCQDELIKKQEEIHKYIDDNKEDNKPTCDDLETRICGMVDRAKECCQPCQGTISQILLCEDGDAFTKDQECPAVQQCVAEAIASGGAATIAGIGGCMMIGLTLASFVVAFF